MEAFAGQTLLQTLLDCRSVKKEGRHYCSYTEPLPSAPHVDVM